MSRIVEFSEAHRLLLCFLLCFPSLAVGQVSRMDKCSEIAHRIACHSVAGACKNKESNRAFEKRFQLENMIIALCTNGPKDFANYYWIDVDGAYRPYYIDKQGNTTKFPDETGK